MLLSLLRAKARMAYKHVHHCLQIHPALQSSASYFS